LIADRTGHAPKVILSDSGSEQGASPIIDPKSAATKSVPQGRGKYQLAGEIARGGMGVILKGHDTDLGRDVALKVLDKELAKNPSVVQRFVEEAQIGGQLQHPGIVPVYELGLMADDSPYFTMKLVKGRTLAALFLQRKNPADNRGRMLAIFESVCQTMAYAHSKGVLHRDLKPANIMVGAFGEVQVVDWGLAKVLHRGGVADEKRAQQPVHTIIETVRSGSSSSGSDSIVGSVMGTPAYMAPEQAQGEIDMLDERADVFSLGAILCELLTGRPPYEPIEGETIVMQAARAKLKPARDRIEACDADPALVRLCLDCLMPGREARLPNAEVVAKAMHEYLATVEERAQKAELAAAEARIKAAEERRARRLTLALAGTIVGAIALGGGALYWVGHERAQRAEEHAQRAEQTRTSVEAAYGESIELGRAGKPAEALAAARRALSLAETGDADAALLERAKNFVAKAEQDVGAAERAHKLVVQDEKLRSRLIDLRLQQIATIDNNVRQVELDQAFAQAFHDYGVDLEGDDLVPALKRIRERSIAEEVALSLDDWGHLRRKVHGAKSEKAENLYYLAMDLDPEPVRKRMRQAVAENDLKVMLELTSADKLAELEPGSIFVLSTALWDASDAQRPEVFRIIEQALRLYPGDFVLQACAGFFYQGGGRFENALACRTAALSLRPHDAAARVKVGESLLSLGRLTAAAATLQAAVAQDPSSLEGLSLLGEAQMMLGDYSGAYATLTSSPKLEADANIRSDVLAAKFCTGHLTRDEMEDIATKEYIQTNLLTYLIVLVDHPDPKQDDPEFVLRTLADQSAVLGNARWASVIATIAHVRKGDWAAALATFEDRYKLPQVMILTPMAHDFLRSLIYSHVGRHAEAQLAYKRGMVQWEEQTVDDPKAWEQSDAARWRRAAEAALAN
jgi:serine/threonine-protein kinase